MLHNLKSMLCIDFDVTKVSKEIVLQLLKHEQTLRYSKRYQEMYDQGLNTRGNPEYIERTIQRETLNHFGFQDTDTSLKNYQEIGTFYQGDKTIKEAVQYLRLNIIKDCPVLLGDTYVDCELVSLDENDLKLSSIIDITKPTIIIAGSIT